MLGRIVRSLTIVTISLAAGIGVTYASFTSSAVTVANAVLTTGEANLKLCDVAGENQWTTTISPLFNLVGMSPGETRDIFPNRKLYLGNDNGSLGTSLPTNECQLYGPGPLGNSTVPIKLVPKVTYTDESCPSPMPSNIKIGFEIKGTATEDRTLTSWSSNATQFEPAFIPGEEGEIKAHAILSSTTTSQNVQCSFNIDLTGKQSS